MPITLDEARAHLRLDPDYPDGQLQPYVDAALDAAERYLNRRVFADQAALDAAFDAAPAQLAAAQAAYAQAVADAQQLPDLWQREAAIEVANERMRGARTVFNWTVMAIVETPSIKAAMLLILGDLYARREDGVEVATSARILLRPYRRVMMP